MHRLAVDLGTCNTVAVVAREGSGPRALVFDGSPMLPSAVFLDQRGSIHVGRDAERLMVDEPARFEPFPKRRVDDGAVFLGDREVPVADLLAAVLRRVAAESALAGVPAAGGAVLTCPVRWGTARRETLHRAAATAGFGPVTLVDEPIAAAWYCSSVLGQRLAPDRCLVVFDFGGGTLDVTVVRNDRGGPAVLGTGGLDDLGGADIDAALVGVLGRSDPAWQRLLAPRGPADLRDRQLGWIEARAAKEMLSRATVAPVRVPGADRSSHLTRDELHQAAAPLVERAVEETARVLHRCGVHPAALDAILLVGGSSRLPLVASRLHARFGVAPVVPEQPELPVAYGALYVGSAPASPAGSTTSPAVGSAGPAASAVSPVSPVSAVSAGHYPPAPEPISGPISGPVSGPGGYGSPVSGGPGGYGSPVSGPGVYGSPGAYGSPVSGAPGGYAAPGPASVVIGPGVRIEGSVHIRGAGAPSMPDDDTDDEPDDESTVDDYRPRPSILSSWLGRTLFRLIFIAIPITIIMVANPPVRAFVLDLIRDFMDG